KNKILKIIDRYKLYPKTRLLGFKPYPVLMKEAYSHDIFISPSVTAHDGDTEGGAPVTIIEMAAMGIPVVSTNHCDIPEIIKDGETGFLSDERDVNGLAKKLEWLINNNHKWLSIQEKARRHVEKEYNARLQGVRLSEIYRELLN
ncbi:MAG: glycosyltransferase, partial [Candidatus Thorarchaeota archaeon]